MLGGIPYGSIHCRRGHALFYLAKAEIWWLRLAITAGMVKELREDGCRHDGLQERFVEANGDMERATVILREGPCDRGEEGRSNARKASSMPYTWGRIGVLLRSTVRQTSSQRPTSSSSS